MCVYILAFTNCVGLKHELLFLENIFDMIKADTDHFAKCQMVQKIKVTLSDSIGL